jgi:glutamate-ammonia-ligase adenylyltransferase
VSISPSDLFLSPDLTEEQAREYLTQFGFRDPAAADEHLQAFADESSVREALADLCGSLLEALMRAPDPDAALIAFIRYTATRSSRTMFLRYLIDDPRALDVLIEVVGTSPFLGEILIRNAEYLHWLVSQIGREPPEPRISRRSWTRCSIAPTAARRSSTRSSGSSVARSCGSPAATSLATSRCSPLRRSSRRSPI